LTCRHVIGYGYSLTRVGHGEDAWGVIYVNMVFFEGVCSEQDRRYRSTLLIAVLIATEIDRGKKKKDIHTDSGRPRSRDRHDLLYQSNTHQYCLPFTNTCNACHDQFDQSIDGPIPPPVTPPCDAMEGTSQNLWPVSRQIPLLCRHAGVIQTHSLSRLSQSLTQLIYPVLSIYLLHICLTTSHDQSLSH
jgi:hypothetical protein